MTQLTQNFIDPKIAFISSLRYKNSPAVLDKNIIRTFFSNNNISFSESSIARLLVQMEQQNAIEKISSGVWINRLRNPQPTIDMAASKIRSNAIIGLATVLGQNGFLNNISTQIDALLPFSNSKPFPKLGKETTSAGHVFYFRGLPERFFPSNQFERELFLNKNKNHQFNSEKSLLDWLYLANSTRSNLLPPPDDIDLTDLNIDLYNKCNNHLNLSFYAESINEIKILINKLHKQYLSKSISLDPLNTIESPKEPSPRDRLMAKIKS